jgi:hypothetical protein
MLNCFDILLRVVVTAPRVPPVRPSFLPSHPFIISSADRRPFLLLRCLDLVGAFPHLLSDLVSPIVHVLECLLVLTVLCLKPHLGDCEPSDAEDGSYSDDGSCLHIGCWWLI